MEVVPGDLFAIDVELGEERLVQQRPDCLIAASVCVLWRGVQGEGILDDLLAEFQVLVGTLERLPNVGCFLTNDIDALA